MGVGAASALDVARGLAQAGCVLFRAPSMRLPARWQESRPGPDSLEAVADWRPGDGLALVGGTVFDVLDVDPRNGGTASEASLREAGLWPRAYGVASTPSGGTHHLIRALGIGKCVAASGIDLQGGRPDGTGRGFVWLAPTVRASKLDGVPHAYEWVIRPGIGGAGSVAELDGDDTGEGLSGLLSGRRESSGTGPDDAGTTPVRDRTIGGSFAGPGTGVNGAGGVNGHDHRFTRAQAGAYVKPWLEELRTARDGTINDTLNKAAIAIGHFVPTVLDRGTAEVMLKDALKETVYDGRTWKAEDTIRSGLDAAVREPGGWVAELVSEDAVPVAKMRVTRASGVAMRRTRYTWEGRYPVGVMTFLAGREGTGKSTVAYDRAACLTRGTLPGEHEGRPRSVVVCAGEDSWEHTIVPRLVAAGADLDLILHVEAVTEDGPMELSLPRDTVELAGIVRDENVGMIVLDPLMSMLDQKMNSDKYQEVYAALRPVIGMAAVTGVAVIGITHLNKTAGADPLSRLMASRAFSAAPRSILMTHLDESGGEDDENDFAGPGDSRPVERFILGHEKHNLGPKAKTLAYHIETADVGWDDGPIVSSRIVWDGESTNTVAKAMQDGGMREKAPAVRGAAKWLRAFLSRNGGIAEVPTIKIECEKAGESYRSVRRATEEPGFVKYPPAPGRPARWGLAGVDLDSDS